MINSRFLDGLSHGRGLRRSGQPAREGNARRQAGRSAQDQFPPARLGHLAPALLGLPDPRHPLRGLRHRAGAREGLAGPPAGRRDVRQARQPAGSSSDVEARGLSDVREGRAPRDGHDGHVRRQLLVLRALHGAARRRRRSTRTRRITGCRSINTSAASSTRSCTCSIRGSSIGRSRIPGTAPRTCASRSRRSSRREW